MSEESSLRGVIQFLEEVGVYDVVLPFLLVFTIMFAILEKTRILGTETVEGVQYTKKNLNSMMAFVSAFLVIASTRLVAIINATVANAVLILIMITLFLLLMGSMYKEGEEVFIGGGLRWGLTGAIGIALLLIVFNAIGWLDDIGGWFARNYTAPWFQSIILVLFIVIIMTFIVQDRKAPSKKTST